MGNETKVINKININVATILGIVFIVLKLCKVITWSWVWVLAPFWISWAIALVVIILAIIVCLITSV